MVRGILATQTLVLFVIRTRRTPFFRSKPSAALLISTLSIVAIAAAIPFTPLARSLGFTPLPAGFFLAMALMIVVYLALAETAKHWFFRNPPQVPTERTRRTGYRMHRRAARFSIGSVLPALLLDQPHATDERGLDGHDAVHSAIHPGPQ
ncbi:cation transporting ATPase C-terminal domain-containing protein [Nocardia sp. SYP-A9097]|uniref:cation transporting ATPase C-terminal domain-containing protein n=1 Tax=Nocardia sp. SYP-A9097 TaxID=2663237 RepID=UPI002815D926|nr:cation transporting ATPase C-terminal domain-containing protein [Nocardia sp. SYP-A9097]